MLQCRDLCKEYVTGDLVQTALDDVSFNLRDSEFVAILGPSGSGKTTLLNVIGGLDRYDSGDIIINGTSTKNYKDRDWDNYRNHTIGFIFQSYNLIPHQSVLANVELAMTISGVSRSARRQRALDALDKVGLKDQAHKRPNQMSGGQMQRVAIARALVNDPDIVLADEPTGALDSETSVQVMNLLREVAKDRLVVMVTHNNDLAEEYATRIIRLYDGRIIGDTNPFEIAEPVPKDGEQMEELLRRLVRMITKNDQMADEYARKIAQEYDGNLLTDGQGAAGGGNASGAAGVSGASGASGAQSTGGMRNADMPQTRRRHKSAAAGKRAYMGFGTALGLSFNNLRTKKSRTILTAFAGSIGIIGIALIQALSGGVDKYITDIQRETMASYPITIDEETLDLTSLLTENQSRATTKADHALDGVYSNSAQIEMQSNLASSYKENNLTKFKEYLDDPDSEIAQYIGEDGVVYSYDVRFGAYTIDPDDVLVNTDGVTIGDDSSSVSASSGMMASMADMSEMFGGSSSIFSELTPGSGGSGLSASVTDNYDLVYGRWPESYDEVVVVLDQNNEISLTILYELGMLPSSEYSDLMDKLNAGDSLDLDQQRWSYRDLAAKTIYLIPACDQYQRDENGGWTSISEDADALRQIVDSGKALPLTISGMIRPNGDTANTGMSEMNGISGTIGYTRDLTDYLIDYANDSEIVKEQKDSEDVNVLNGLTFEPKDDKGKAADAVTYMNGLNISEKANLYRSILTQQAQDDPAQQAQIQAMGEADLAAQLDAQISAGMDTDTLVSIYDTYVDTGTYDDNMTAFGVVSADAPSSISIYTDSFSDKEAVTQCIEDYNDRAKDEDKITYTDYVALMTTSVMNIVNVISYVLIAFVSVSLIVSSIMIGIITYISVLERTKEIGILRALGASRRNISQVFNAETFIIGLLSGVMGIAISLVLQIPINAVMHHILETNQINAALPVTAAVFLVVLSVLLTLIGGLIPAKKAAKMDPVTALRSE